MSNRNLLVKDGLNTSSIDWEQTKNTTKNLTKSIEFNSVKNSMNKSKSKNKNTICFSNLKQQQINLKFENEQWTPCSFCCKSIKNKFNQMYKK